MSHQFAPSFCVEKRKQWWQIVNHKNKISGFHSVISCFYLSLPYSHPPLVKFITVWPLILYTYTKFKGRILCWIKSYIDSVLTSQWLFTTKEYKVLVPNYDISSIPALEYAFQLSKGVTYKDLIVMGDIIEITRRRKAIKEATLMSPNSSLLEKWN